MAILGETVGTSHMSKTIGIVTMFVTAGLFCGPAISGTLFELAGYTTTWITALGVLLGGTVLQLLMMEQPKMIKKRNLGKHRVSGIDGNLIESAVSSNVDILVSADSYPNEECENENSVLIIKSPNQSSETLYQSISQPTPPQMVFFPEQEYKQARSRSVYFLLLCRARVLVALAGDIAFAMIIASFEATLPLHIQAVFGWKAMGAGLSFVLMQLPALVLVGPTGWLKDKVGLRYPISIGFLLFAPSLWLLGLPGSGHFEWINRGERGPTIFIVALILIGVSRTLVLGFGGLEVMSMFSTSHHFNRK